MNVIVPLAGNGIRFLSEGYWRPKPFIKARGRELIVWLLTSLNFDREDTLVLIFNQNPKVGLSPEKFFVIVHEALLGLGQRKPEVIYVPLGAPTVGAAETVLRGIEALSKERIQRPCVLLDGDTFYRVDVLQRYREHLRHTTTSQAACGGCVFVFEDDKPNESPYSYVKLDYGTTRLSAIKEKCKQGMDALACSGCYCFNDTHDLMDGINQALVKHKDMELESRTESHLQNCELYTSSVIAHMMANGTVFHAIKVNGQDFTVLGTPQQLQSFISSEPWITDVKRFCFDLDSTLVTSPIVAGDYTTCKPIESVVAYLRKLHTEGHHIIIHTARRMRTHGGNVGRVIADIGELTIRQLKEFAIPYDELVFGKPYADFYIDDKAVLPYVDLYKETGMQGPHLAGHLMPDDY